MAKTQEVNPYGLLASVSLVILVLYLYQQATLEPFQGPVTNLLDVPFHIEKKDGDGPLTITGVPTVIYHSWHSNKVPPKMRENIFKLLNMNPEFEYYLYSDESSYKYIQENFPKEVLDTFEGLKPGAYKSDLWRYCIMYKKGGVYMDIKYYTLEPLKDIISKSPTVFVRDKDWSANNFNCYYNGIMISPPNNPVFKHCIEEIVSNYKMRQYNINALDVTGPCVLGRQLKKYDVQLWSSSRFNFNREYIHGLIIDYIMYDGNRIMQSYPEYRGEQKATQATEHYGKMWADRDIYVSSK
jgi:hypothetical protein